MTERNRKQLEAAGVVIHDPATRERKQLPLTERQRATVVAWLHAHGRQKAAAAAIGMQYRTFEKHKRLALAKLGIDNAVDLVLWGIREGVIV